MTREVSGCVGCVIHCASSILPDDFGEMTGMGGSAGMVILPLSGAASRSNAIATDGEFAVFDLALDDALAEVWIVVVADGFLRVAELAEIIHQMTRGG